MHRIQVSESTRVSDKSYIARRVFNNADSLGPILGRTSCGGRVPRVRISINLVMATREEGTDGRILAPRPTTWYSSFVTTKDS